MRRECTLSKAKPIDFGVKEFCKKCKICAERCVTGAISHKDEPGIEFGYNRWKIQSELCFQVWTSLATGRPRGCRVCLAVYPYTRKNNWLHMPSKNMDARDRTGMTSSMLLWMQKKFFDYPEARDFLPPPKGKNATYHMNMSLVVCLVSMMMVKISSTVLVLLL